MAAKLKSITRQIHWSLLLKAVIFGAAWFFLPSWIFFLTALYCYFVPLFRTGRYAIPFAVLLVLCAFHAPSVAMACIFGAIFYYLLLTKELWLIDRATARSFLVMVLSFFLFREFYSSFANGPVGIALIAAFASAALFGCLMHNLIGNFRRSYEEDGEGRGDVRNVASWLSFILVSQCLIIGLFLPLDFIYQSVLVFLAAALIIDFMPNHVFGLLSSEKIRLTSVVFFALFVIVLASARWGL
jgi:hypothetical protein